MPKIGIFSVGVNFQVKQKRIIKAWMESIVQSESFHVKQINLIFCDDLFLLNINKQYLSHDYYTDIITFDLADSELNIVESEIYISVDSVLENSNNLKLSFSEELYRVIAHGILHLVGYNDKKKTERERMREKESQYIAKLLLFHVKQSYNIKRGV